MKYKKLTVSSSESCNPSSSLKKKFTYSEANNVISFKIDIRISSCYNDLNHDLANRGAACHLTDDKIVQNEGKLPRESKKTQYPRVFPIN